MKRLHNLILLTCLLLSLVLLSVGCSQKVNPDLSDVIATNSIQEGITHATVLEESVTPVVNDTVINDTVINDTLPVNDTEVSSITGQHKEEPKDYNAASKATISKQSDSSDENTEKKRIIAIDAGHQLKGNYDKEPIGPGSKTKKAKVSSGTQGSYTKVPEYELNLAVAKKVKKELIERGYEVVMIREKNDVNLSNRERAEIANESGADVFIRIHADGSTNPKVNGASTLYPSKKNPYVAELSKPSYALSKAIVDAMCEKTGAKNRGAIARDDMSGINWCTIPVTIIEMGYMTNKTEDKLMQTKKYQDKIVQGICDGIDQYFEDLEEE